VANGPTDPDRRGAATEEASPEAGTGRPGQPHLRPLPGQEPAVGEGTVPTFLALLFATLPLWAIWYFLTHLAPLLAIEPPGFAARAPEEVRTYRAAAAPPGDPHLATLARGAAVYAERCALCHGPDGAGPPPGQPYTPAKALRGDPLVRALSLPQLEELIAGGFPGAMPAWGEELGTDQLQAVAAYVQEVLGPAPPPAAPST
jgi:mono/diheme cytochrome c family protein